MRYRPARVIALALASLLVACAAQVAAPRDTEPSASASAKPSATNATTDVLYIQGAGSGVDARISVIDARTGTIVRELPNGVLSRDRSLLYTTEALNGGTQTRIRVLELATGRETRSFTIDGYFHTLFDYYAPIGPAGEGSWLVLTGDPIKLDDKYVTRYAVVNTVTGAASNLELRGDWPYEFIAVSPDGKRIYLTDLSASSQPVGVRAFDLTARALAPVPVPGSAWNKWQAGGWRSGIVTSADGRWSYSVNTATEESSFILALDAVNDRAYRIELPADQTAGFEKAMLWSLVPSNDGKVLFAVNPAIGAINEIAIPSMTIRRTAHIPVSRADDGVLAALRQALFPVADAKRLLRSGATLSPDGRTLYAAGERGIAVIEIDTLSERTVLAKDISYDTLALSPDGERMYVITPDAWSTIAIMRTRDGSSAGTFRLPWYPGAIVRVDLGR
jgi:DNA-binding beta-propeller fold protein YncE